MYSTGCAVVLVYIVLPHRTGYTIHVTLRLELRGRALTYFAYILNIPYLCKPMSYKNSDNAYKVVKNSVNLTN